MVAAHCEMTMRKTADGGGAIPRTFEDDKRNCVICNDNGNLAGKGGMPHAEKQPVTETEQGSDESSKDKIDTQTDKDPVAWYAMRDLTRPNALNPAYKMLRAKGFEVFTPMKRKTERRGGGTAVVEVPAIHDLLFVRSTMSLIDPVEASTPTLRYRFVKGGRYREPITVRDGDMEVFIKAVTSAPSPEYFLPGEITLNMVGRKALVHGGPLDGHELRLLKVQGSKRKRVMVELPGLLAAVVELAVFDSMEIVKG